MGLIDTVRSRRLRIKPQVDAYRVRMKGTAIRVVRGAAIGTRITLDEPAAVTSDNTHDASNGSWIVAPFDEFFVHFPADVVTPTWLELEVWTCAALAVAPMDREAPLTRFGVLVRGEDVVLQESTNRIAIALEPDVRLDGRGDLFSLVENPAGTFTGTPRSDFQPIERPFTYLDGAVTGDADYTIRVYHVLNLDGSKRVLIGTASATAASTITGTWDVTLSCGITPGWSSGRTPGPVPIGPFGVEIELVPDTVAATTVDFLFWLRGP